MSATLDGTHDPSAQTPVPVHLQAAPALSGTPVPEACAEHPVLDVATLKRLRGLQRPGRPDVVGKLTTLYVSESTALMQELRAAVAGGDKASIRRFAHGLKSCSANVGATWMASLCRLLEGIGSGEAGEDAHACFLLAERVHALTLQALSETLSPTGVLALPQE